MKRSKISLLFDNTHFLFISIILLIYALYLFTQVKGSVKDETCNSSS